MTIDIYVLRLRAELLFNLGDDILAKLRSVVEEFFEPVDDSVLRGHRCIVSNLALGSKGVVYSLCKKSSN